VGAGELGVTRIVRPAAVTTGAQVAAVVGGRVVGPERTHRADVLVRGSRIAAVDIAPEHRDADGEVLDASGLLVAPGFVDLQCNGAVGIDLGREPERLWEVAAALPRWGVTSWLPTIVTAPRATRDRAIAGLTGGPPPGTGPHAAPLGLHLEGPFLSPARAGAHRIDLLAAPDEAEAASWSRAGGVAMVTLAPELLGAGAVVADLTARGVVVAAGHSEATAEEAGAAVDAGVRMVTHLFNAMAPMHHRAPGLAGVALADHRVVAGVIADGIHVHPTAVAVAAAALGDRLALVTDAVGALGAPPGSLAVGSVDAIAGPDGVRLADGTLAGSDLSMDQAVRNLRAFTGWSVDAAIGAATTVPARVLGASDRGTIARGAVADLVLLTPDLEVVATVCAGEVAWRS
jgi:N-acetylglucosamine-6-phosphate deacetylase